MEDTSALCPLPSALCPSLPFPEFDVVDLTSAEVEGFEVDLGLAGHVDVSTVKAMLLAVDAEDEAAFLEFDGDIMPCIERKQRGIDHPLFDVFFEHQGGGFFTEGERVNVMPEIDQRKAFAVSRAIITQAKGADEVLRHLFQPDHWLKASMSFVPLGDHFFLELFRGLAACKNPILDDPGAALADLPEFCVHRSLKGIFIDQLGALKQF